LWDNQESVHGPGYFEKTDIAKFQEDLNAKLTVQAKKNAELADLEQEVTILKHTEAVLKGMLSETVNELKAYEIKYGVTGLLTIEADIEELTKKKGNLDYLKGKTLEELTTIIETLKNKLEEKREVLKPLVEEHKELRAQIKETEEDHKRKRGEYERVIADAKEEHETVLRSYREVKEPLAKTKIAKTVLQEKTKALGLTKNLLDAEARFTQGSGAFSKEARTLKEAMAKELGERETRIQSLREQREAVKEASNNVVEQNKMLTELKNLLEEKLKSKKRAKATTTSSFKTIREQYNRAVID
jgi:intraflagellar transport protein 81